MPNRWPSSQARFDPLATRAGCPAHPGRPRRWQHLAPRGHRPAPACAGADLGALPRLGVWRLSHRADDQGEAPGNRHRAGRRFRQYRTARAGRAARVRLFRLRHAGRRRAPAARPAGQHLRPAMPRQTPGQPSPAGAMAGPHLRPSDEGQVQYFNIGRARRSLRGSRHHRPGTACRSTATCRCWTCSTPCTGCGAMGAGTSSPSRTAATGRNAASATSGWTTSAATTRASAKTAGRPHRSASSPRPGRPAFTLSTRPRRPRRSRRWPRSCCGAAWPFPGGATSALKNPSRPSWPSCWPTAAASPFPAGWKWPPTGCWH